MPLKIKLVSIMVDDQDKALDFYTNKLGFIKKLEIDMGEHKWISVVSSDSDYMELGLEPNVGVPEAKVYQKALLDNGIPATAFDVDDIETEHKKLVEKGVLFKSEPKDVGGIKVAILHDTVGNLIQIQQVPKL
ncbi:glyoxalase bleomycin resistance protein dioxygenase [Seminavis robusta]|uniref:Glyoxalase bleomycin resistance protein dioxygenase n=1 Tax=Seminavis robusta TaxID=568900 RepID=A0A9N8EJP8_9STRA|nr:glyoxalase bleomycin resistance protein dioxygenase [Seminavis robusta]|eukprot:Sro1256_g256650.1 glyoxalase bleomycin resistance protein dioxygenase (133) ;mRNA; r:22885-23283